MAVPCRLRHSRSWPANSGTMKILRKEKASRRSRTSRGAGSGMVGLSAGGAWGLATFSSLGLLEQIPIELGAGESERGTTGQQRSPAGYINGREND